MVFPVLVGAEAPEGALSVQAAVSAAAAAASALINVNTVPGSVFLEAGVTRQADGGEVGGGVVQQPPYGRTARAVEVQLVEPALHVDPGFVVVLWTD